MKKLKKYFYNRKKSKQSKTQNEEKCFVCGKGITNKKGYIDLCDDLKCHADDYRYYGY